MTTLGTNQLQLSRIQRNRDLANALRQQAMSFEPIRHPYQGLAKLAQALVAAQMDRRSDKRQEALAEENRKMMADALAEVPAATDAQGYPVSVNTLQGIQLEGFDDVPAETLITSGQRVMPMRDKTPQEMLAALPPEIGQQVIANVLTNQLSARSDEKVRSTEQFGRVSSEGFITDRIDAVPGTEQYNQLVSDPNYVRVTIPSGVTRNLDVTPKLSSNDYTKIEETLGEAWVAFDQIDRLRAATTSGALSPDTMVGAIRDLGNRTVATLESLGETFSGRVEYDQVLQQSGAYSKWSNTMRAYERGVEQGAKRYTAADIAANESFMTRFAKLDASFQQNAISLAYTLARIADPGGRLSEMDVINQMRGLQLDNPSKDARMQALSDAERSFAVKIKARLYFAQARAADAGQRINVPPELQQRIEATTGPIGSAPPPVQTPEGLVVDPVLQKWLNDASAEDIALVIKRNPETARRLGLIP